MKQVGYFGMHSIAFHVLVPLYFSEKKNPRVNNNLFLISDTISFSFVEALIKYMSILRVYTKICELLTIQIKAISLNDKVTLLGPNVRSFISL